MKWLFVTTSPWPMTNGTALRVWHLSRVLCSAGHEVTLATDSRLAEFETAYSQLGVRVIIASSDAHAGSSTGRWRLWPFEPDAALADAVATQSGNKDAVVLAGPPSMQYAYQAQAAGCVIADIIDDPVLSVRRRRGISGSLRVRLRRMRKLLEFRLYERRCLPHISSVTFVSDADRDAFLQRHHSVPAFTVPNGVDINYFGAVADAPSPKGGPTRVLFVGNYSFVPNYVAADFLYEKVAPLVWVKHPETVFQFVGPNPTAAMTRWTDRRVEVTGMVDDVRDFLRGATVAVIPMLTGTGIKNKLLEAWAAGVPVVATRLACQGVPARPDENVLLGEGAQGFAEAIGRAFADSNLRNKLAFAGRETAEREFAWSRMSDELFRMATKLISDRQTSKRN